MTRVTIYCDGSGSTAGNPCGWAAILVCGEHYREVTGGCADGTNNHAELMAAISGLEALKFPCEVTLISDSEYVVKGIDHRIRKYAVNGWRRADKEPVKNRELLERLLVLMDKHRIEAKWIKGHNGHPQNERCDELATIARKSYLEEVIE